MDDNKPPVRHTLFERLLKQTGVVINTEPLQVIKAPFDGRRLISSWDGLMEKLVSQK